MIFVNIVLGEMLGGLVAFKFEKDKTMKDFKRTVLHKTIVPSVQIDDELVGIYKMISSSGIYNGTNFSFNESDLTGSIMTISKDGIITQNVFLNGTALVYYVGYISYFSKDKITGNNVLTGAKNDVAYTFNNDILTTNLYSYLLTETDKWEKIYDIASENYSYSYNLKEYCIRNPDKCNITIMQTSGGSTDNLTNYVIQNRQWHLLDYDSMMALLEAFKSNEKVIKVIWNYDNGKWYAFSFDSVMMNKIKSSKINILKKLERKKGYWVYLNGSYPVYSFVDYPKIFDTDEFDLSRYR